MVVPIAAVLCSEHPGRASSDALGRALRQRGPQRAALHVVSSPGTGMVPGTGAGTALTGWAHPPHCRSLGAG